MSEDAAIVERVPDVELAGLVSQVAPHTELDASGLESAAIRSDAAQQSGQYVDALAGAQALLAGLVRDISYELRRSPSESVETFRTRSRPAISVRRHSRFLVQKRFLSEREKETLQRAAAMTESPTPDAAVSLAAWSRLARQMVYAVADQLLTRFAAWQVGCSCEAGGPVESVVFQPLGGDPLYERAICRRCRCPRQTVAASAQATADDEPTVRLTLVVTAGPGIEVTPTAVPASQSEKKPSSPSSA